MTEVAARLAGWLEDDGRRRCASSASSRASTPASRATLTDGGARSTPSSSCWPRASRPDVALAEAAGIAARRGRRDRRRRGDAHQRAGGARVRRLLPRRARAWPGGRCTSSTGATRSAQGEVAGRAAAGRRRGLDGGPGLLVDDRRSHAQVRRVGRRLRRRAPRRPRRRRLHRLVRARRRLRRRARPRARRRTTSQAASASSAGSRRRERAPRRRRGPGPRRGGADRALPGRTRRASAACRPDEFAVIVVLDGCRDDTEAVAAGGSARARSRSSWSCEPVERRRRHRPARSGWSAPVRGWRPRAGRTA